MSRHPTPVDVYMRIPQYKFERSGDNEPRRSRYTQRTLSALSVHQATQWDLATRIVAVHQIQQHRVSFTPDRERERRQLDKYRDAYRRGLVVREARDKEGDRWREAKARLEAELEAEEEEGEFTIVQSGDRRVAVPPGQSLRSRPARELQAGPDFERWDRERRRKLKEKWGR